jgi:hypothetical protein
MTSGRITVIIVAVALVAVVAVIVSSVDFGGGDDSEPAAEQQQEEPEAPPDNESEEEPAPEPEEVEEPEVPENPDDTHGSDSFALTRSANFRKGLATLEAKRRGVEGVFDGLRVAPGRIDTVIIHPDDRRTNIQVRPDFDL